VKRTWPWPNAVIMRLTWLCRYGIQGPLFYRSSVCCIQIVMTDSKESRRELFKSIGFLSGVGISMVAATFIGFGMGYYLDQWFDTRPWLTMTFLVLGIIAGFRNVYILTARELRRQKREEQLEKDRDAEG